MGSYTVLNDLSELIGHSCICIYGEKEIDVLCKVLGFEYVIDEELTRRLSVLVKLLPIKKNGIDEDDSLELQSGVCINDVIF